VTNHGAENVVRAIQAAFAFALIAQSSAYAADCKKFEDILSPVLADFKGKPGEYAIDAQKLLQPPPLGAVQCIAMPSTTERAKASLHCFFRFDGETAARTFFQSYVNGVSACQPGQKPLRFNTPLKDGEVDRAGTRNSANDRGWLFRLMREGAGFKVVVMGTAVPVIPWED
jgi:hypothetical protein